MNDPIMKDTLITVLRDRHSSPEKYRAAANNLGLMLAARSSEVLENEKVSVETPLAKTQGTRLARNVILVPILRSGLVLLSPFLNFFPEAPVGFIGTRRDETTAIPSLYYSKLPKIHQDTSILLLDPMLATGGSATLAIKVLKEAGANESKIALMSVIAAPQGVEYFKAHNPKARLVVLQLDQGLDEHMRILPGIGDYGDRYFGTPDE